MRLLGLKTFRHGVHPPESKEATSGLAIRQFPFAPLLVVPLIQHMGKPSIPRVQEGQEVVRGQKIADADGFMSVAMHAPASGVVRKIARVPSIGGRNRSGLSARQIFMSHQYFGNLLANRHDWVQRCHRLLEYHGHT